MQFFGLCKRGKVLDTFAQVQFRDNKKYCLVLGEVLFDSAFVLRDYLLAVDYPIPRCNSKIPSNHLSGASMKVVRFNIAKPIDLTWPEFGKTLRDIQFITAKALNHCMTELYLWQREKEELKEANGKYPRCLPTQFSPVRHRNHAVAPRRRPTRDARASAVVPDS